SRIRDAHTTLDTNDADDQAARSLLKQTYTRTIGMMGSSQYMKSSRHYWPERRHHIVAKARANLLRQILTIGNKSNVWPLARSEEHTSELQSRFDLVCRLLLEKKKKNSHDTRDDTMAHL